MTKEYELPKGMTFIPVGRNLPESVKIGQRIFKIEEKIAFEDDYVDTAYGYVTFNSDRIILRKDLTPSMRRSTLLHEIMHACRAVFAAYPPKPDSFDKWFDLEHWFIGVWEESLLTVLRDNPEVTRFLMEGIENELR